MVPITIDGKSDTEMCVSEMNIMDKPEAAGKYHQN
jgi:hypothetical protein